MRATEQTRLVQKATTSTSFCDCFFLPFLTPVIAPSPKYHYGQDELIEKVRATDDSDSPDSNWHRRIGSNEISLSSINRNRFDFAVQEDGGGNLSTSAGR